MNVFLELPPEISQEILYKLEPYEINRMCKLNSYFRNKVCTQAFNNLYKIKNKIDIYKYEIKELKKTYIGEFYSMIGYDDSRLFLMDIKGFLKYYNLTTNTITDIEYNGIKKYIVDIDGSLNYIIDYNGNLARLDPFKILFTPEYGFKIKDAIIVMAKIVRLHTNGNLYFGQSLIKKNIKQISENLSLPDVVMIDHDGNVSLFDTVNNHVTDLNFKTKFEYIHKNLNSTYIFLRDLDGWGWVIDTKIVGFMPLGVRLRQGLYFLNGTNEPICVGIDYNDQVVYQYNPGEKLSMKILKSKQKAINIYNINNELVVEYTNPKDI